MLPRTSTYGDLVDAWAMERLRVFVTRPVAERITFTLSIVLIVVAAAVFGIALASVQWVAFVAEFAGGLGVVLLLATAPDRFYRKLKNGAEIGKEVGFWLAAVFAVLALGILVGTLVVGVQTHWQEDLSSVIVIYAILALVGLGASGVLLPPTVSRRWRPTYSARMASVALPVLAIIGSDIVLTAALLQPEGESWRPILVGGLVALTVAGIKQLFTTMDAHRKTLDDLVELFDETISAIDATVPWHGCIDQMAQVDVDTALSKLDRHLHRASWPRRRPRDLAEQDLYVIEYLSWAAHSTRFRSMNSGISKLFDPIVGASGQPPARILSDGLFTIRQRLIDHRIVTVA